VLRIRAWPKRKRAAGLVHPAELATCLVYHLALRLVQVDSGLRVAEMEDPAFIVRADIQAGSRTS